MNSSKGYIANLGLFWPINHMEGKWKFCILKKFQVWEMAFFLARFYLKNDKNSKNEQLLSHF